MNSDLNFLQILSGAHKEFEKAKFLVDVTDNQLLEKIMKDAKRFIYVFDANGNLLNENSVKSVKIADIYPPLFIRTTDKAGHYDQLQMTRWQIPQSVAATSQLRI